MASSWGRAWTSIFYRIDPGVKSDYGRLLTEASPHPVEMTCVVPGTGTRLPQKLGELVGGPLLRSLEQCFDLFPALNLHCGPRGPNSRLTCLDRERNSDSVCGRCLIVQESNSLPGRDGAAHRRS